MVLICAVMYCMAAAHLRQAIAVAQASLCQQPCDDSDVHNVIASDAAEQCNQTAFLTVNVRATIAISIRDLVADALYADNPQ